MVKTQQMPMENHDGKTIDNEERSVARHRYTLRADLITTYSFMKYNEITIYRAEGRCAPWSNRIKMNMESTSRNKSRLLVLRMRIRMNREQQKGRRMRRNFAN